MSENPLLRQSEPLAPPDAAEDSGLRMNFSGEVAEAFEAKVISSQIPGYEMMRERHLQLTDYFLTKGGGVMDIGCSTGKSIRDLVQFFIETGDRRALACSFNGIDLEEDMIEQANHSMSQMLGAYSSEIKSLVSVRDAVRRGYIKNDEVSYDFKVRDLREHGISPLDSGIRTDVISSIFTLQFLPLDLRNDLLADVYRILQPGGAFIWAEKVLIPSAKMDKVLTQTYYDMKSRNGITDREILKKRSRLENYLLPMTSESNLQVLEGAGFERRNLQLVWKDLHFEMYLAVK